MKRKRVDYQIHQKAKTKNQYTVEFPFGSKIDLSILKSISKISQILPPSVPSNIVFRLNSNIQMPQPFNYDYQLGCLSIDPHSFNYKVMRYDKCQNFHIFHFEPIERSYTPASVIKDLFDQQNTRLGQAFDSLHQTKLNPENFKVVSEQAIDEFEKHLLCIFALYLKIQNGTLTTVARVMNDQYLKMMGTNETMIYDYITSTGCLPWPYQQTEDYQWDQNLLVLFSCNEKQIPIQGQAVNYNGSLFPVYLNQQNYYLYNEQDQSYTQFQYYIYEYNERWSNENQIRQNYLNYFNKRLDIMEKWIKILLRDVNIKLYETLFFNISLNYKQSLILSKFQYHFKNLSVCYHMNCNQFSKLKLYHQLLIQKYSHLFYIQLFGNQLLKSFQSCEQIQ